MPEPESTRWTVIHDAAAGGTEARAEFARLYEPVIRASLEARWRDPVRRGFLEDAVQDVFVECLRDGGALGRADSRLPGGFRAYLYGIVRNVARRHEERRQRSREKQSDRDSALADVAADEETLSHAFDRAWATALLRQAGERFEERAKDAGEAALRRVDLLRLRLVEGHPIREIARRWDEDPERLHYHYKRAREEFKAALREVVRLHDPACSLEAECARLLQHLD